MPHTDDEVSVVKKLTDAMMKGVVEHIVQDAAQNKQMKALLRSLLAHGSPGFANAPIGELTHMFTKMYGEETYTQLLESYMVTHLSFPVVGETDEKKGEVESES